MKYKSTALGMGIPSDGLDDVEKQLQRVMTEESLKLLYSKLPTSRMKFVVAAHYELGYTQQLISEILGIKQGSLVDEIYHIKRVLMGNPYKPQKKSDKVSINDLMNLALLLKQQ